MAWRSILSDLGSTLRPLPSLYIYSVSQLGKYVPGSIWPVVTLMELGRTFAVPRRRSAAAFLLTILSSVSLPSRSEDYWPQRPLDGDDRSRFSRWCWCSCTRLIRPLAARNRLAGYIDPPSTMSSPGGACRWRSSGSVVQWVSLGMGAVVLAHGLGSPVPATQVIGALALSWAAGVLVVIVPAGAGVREGVLIALLAPAMGSGSALTVALLSRLTVTLADGAFAAVGFLVARRARRQPDAIAETQH